MVNAHLWILLSSIEPIVPEFYGQQHLIEKTEAESVGNCWMGLFLETFLCQL